MNEPEMARDYIERDVEAVRSVLIELGQILGAWQGKFVVVGGAVPWLLLPAARPGHIGTLDIDLDLNPEALMDGEYATLVGALDKKGYERGQDGLKAFQSIMAHKYANPRFIGIYVISVHHTSSASFTTRSLNR